MSFLRDVFRAAAAKASGQSFGEYAKEEKERKQREYGLEVISSSLRQAVEAADNLGKLQQILASVGVMFFVQHVSIDTSFLTSRQIDQLQQYTEQLVEERRRGRSVLLEGETVDKGHRNRWTGQQ